MKRKKIYKLKIEKTLKHWSFIKFLKKEGILIFCQNLAINAQKDLKLKIDFIDKNYRCKYLNNDLGKKLLDKKFLKLIKNFKDLIIIDKISDIQDINIHLLNNDNIVLGYYISNYFLYKKDLLIKDMNKNYIMENIYIKINKFIYISVKIINLINLYLQKFILILKKWQL